MTDSPHAFAIMNDIYRTQADLNEGVRYIDTYMFLAGTDGSYQAYHKSENGRTTRVRHPDGVPTSHGQAPR